MVKAKRRHAPHAMALPLRAEMHPKAAHALRAKAMAAGMAVVTAVEDKSNAEILGLTTGAMARAVRRQEAVRVLKAEVPTKPVAVKAAKNVATPMVTSCHATSTL